MLDLVQLGDKWPLMDDADRPFVCGVDVVPKDLNNSDQHFQIVFSTPRLLGNLYQNRAVHIDGTYKLLWMGYPVIVMGVTDIARKFHPVSVALVSGERAEDYAYVMRTTFRAAEQVYGK